MGWDGRTDGPTPADAKERLVRTYARKVRSDARWSRATEPVFRRVSERLNGTFGVVPPAAAAAAAGTEEVLLSAFGWEEAPVGGPSRISQEGLGLGSGQWPPSALVVREWEFVSLTSSSSSSSSSEFGRARRGTRMGDGSGARKPEFVDEGCSIQFG